MRHGSRVGGRTVVLIDASAVAGGAELRADVCVVGAGPAGITVARELQRAGIDVCLLESGGSSPDRRSRAVASAQRVGYPYPALAGVRTRAFGGTSHTWPLVQGWRARPLDPLDFEQRRCLPHSGWPFDRGTLEPHYRAAQAVCGLGPFDYEAERWVTGPANAPLPIGDRDLRHVVFQLGLQDFTHYWDELAQSRRVQLVLHATATEVLTEASADVASGVRVLGPGRNVFSVRARDVVLAAGGIDNARLLLLSDRRDPRGLGNARDLVGRYFMERVILRTGVVIPYDQAAAPLSDFYRISHGDGVNIQGVLTLSDDAKRREELQNCAFFLERRALPFVSQGVRSLATLLKAGRRRPLPERLGGHVRAVVRHLDDVAATAWSRLPRTRSRHQQVLVLRVQAEPAPNPQSRISLADRKDRFGLRMARLDWRLSECDRRSVRRTQEFVGDRLRRIGFGEMVGLLGEEDPPALIDPAHHHLGTTRMHADPQRGVVDADCRVHGIRNLYIAGSSVFPTAGFANPTLTLVALALRLAEHLRRNRAPASVR